MHQKCAGEEKRLPFPLDHFFFCFFAPAAAGAILIDVLVVDEGWSRGRGVKGGEFFLAEVALPDARA